MATLDQFRGCLLGLALGDALGAPFEGGILERMLWRVIGFTKRGEMRWTDDTQMTIDLVESFLAKGQIDTDDLATRFSQSYRWSRGYGPAAAKMLKKIARGADWRDVSRSVYRDGSYGNGAAMRAPVLGLIFENQTGRIIDAARNSAVVTHAHAIGIEGAVLIGIVTGLAAQNSSNSEIVQQTLTHCSLEDFKSRLELALHWLINQEEVFPRKVAHDLGNGVAAHHSCISAVYVALRFRSYGFLEMMKFIAELGGDADTIGAMAGAIWGVINGYPRLPQSSLSQLEQRERLENMAELLHRKVSRMEV